MTTHTLGGWGVPLTVLAIFIAFVALYWVGYEVDRRALSEPAALQRLDALGDRIDALSQRVEVMTVLLGEFGAILSDAFDHLELSCRDCAEHPFEGCELLLQRLDAARESADFVSKLVTAMHGSPSVGCPDGTTSGRGVA